MLRRRAVRLALIGAAGFVCALAVAPPLMRAAGWQTASTFARLLFSALCHQIPERAFYLAGAPAAVCARCLGIYAGCLAGFLAARPGHALPRARWLAAALAPAAIQWLAAWIGGPDGPLLRGLTGGLAGLAVAFFLLPAVDALCGEIGSRRRRRMIVGDLHAKTR